MPSFIENLALAFVQYKSRGLAVSRHDSPKSAFASLSSSSPAFDSKPAAQPCSAGQSQPELGPLISLHKRDSLATYLDWLQVHKPKSIQSMPTLNDRHLLLRCEHWLEAADVKHRYGSNLRVYFDHWVRRVNQIEGQGSACHNWLDNLLNDGRGTLNDEPADADVPSAGGHDSRAGGAGGAGRPAAGGGDMERAHEGEAGAGACAGPGPCVVRERVRGAKDDSTLHTGMDGPGPGPGPRAVFSWAPGTVPGVGAAPGTKDKSKEPAGGWRKVLETVAVSTILQQKSSAGKLRTGAGGTGAARRSRGAASNGGGPGAGSWGGGRAGQGGKECLSLGRKSGKAAPHGGLTRRSQSVGRHAASAPETPFSASRDSTPLETSALTEPASVSPTSPADLSPFMSPQMAMTALASAAEKPTARAGEAGQSGVGSGAGAGESCPRPLGAGAALPRGGDGAAGGGARVSPSRGRSEGGAQGAGGGGSGSQTFGSALLTTLPHRPSPLSSSSGTAWLHPQPAAACSPSSAEGLERVSASKTPSGEQGDGEHLPPGMNGQVAERGCLSQGQGQGHSRGVPSNSAPPLPSPSHAADRIPFGSARQPSISLCEPPTHQSQQWRLQSNSLRRVTPSPEPGVVPGAVVGDSDDGDDECGNGAGVLGWPDEDDEGLFDQHEDTDRHNFFHWLDFGEGRSLDLANLGVPREKLERERVRYLSPEELEWYEVVVDQDTGLLKYKKSGVVLHTYGTECPGGHACISEEGRQASGQVSGQGQAADAQLRGAGAGTVVSVSGAGSAAPSNKQGAEAGKAGAGASDPGPAAAAGHSTLGPAAAGPASSGPGPAPTTTGPAAPAPALGATPSPAASGTAAPGPAASGATPGPVASSAAAPGPAALGAAAAGAADGQAVVTKPNKWIWVSSPDGKLYVAPKIRGHFHHSSFLRGAVVMAAGNMAACQGQLVKLTADSGHYWPQPDHFRWFFEHLSAQGADLRALEGLEFRTKH